MVAGKGQIATTRASTRPDNAFKGTLVDVFTAGWRARPSSGLLPHDCSFIGIKSVDLGRREVEKWRRDEGLLLFLEMMTLAKEMELASVK